MNAGDEVTFIDGRSKDRTFIVQSINGKCYMPCGNISAVADITFKAFGHTAVIRRVEQRILKKVEVEGNENSKPAD